MMWLWIACGALLVLTVVLSVLLRRRGVQARERLAAQEAAHESRTAELERAHRTDVADLESGHEQRVADLRSRLDDANEAARAARERMASSLRWEATSRRMILDVCRRAQADGALVTNVVFMPVDARETRRFVAQIDHVLVFDGALVVIEHKRWQGIVFDGVLPSQVHPSFAHLVDESTLPASFALQVKSESPQSVVINTHLKDQAPSVQVRRQAQRLSQFLGQETGEAPWFDTCVFYSHPDTHVYAQEKDVAAGGAATWIVGDEGRLESLVRDLARMPAGAETRRRRARLLEALSQLGADVARFGAYRDGA